MKMKRRYRQKFSFITEKLLLKHCGRTVQPVLFATEMKCKTLKYLSVKDILKFCSKHFDMHPSWYPFLEFQHKKQYIYIDLCYSISKDFNLFLNSDFRKSLTTSEILFLKNLQQKGTQNVKA